MTPTRHKYEVLHLDERRRSQCERYTDLPPPCTPETPTVHLKVPPSTPKRTPRRKEGKSPFKEILRSAGKFSRSLLSNPRQTVGRLSRQASPVRLDRDEEEGSVHGKDNEENETSLFKDGRRSPLPIVLGSPGRARVRARKEGRRVSRQRSMSRGRSPSPDERKNRSSGSTWQREYRRISPRQARSRHQREPRSGPSLDARPPRASSRSANRQGRRNTTTESDMSDSEGNRRIARMNGLLDIWDARDNPRWEEETFTVCDLDRCGKCGRFYAPMRTVRHTCRVEAG